jgi:hypothetical protein
VRNALTTVTAVTALLVGFAQPSHAMLMLELSDGTTTQTVSDLTNSGTVNFIGAIGNFLFNVTTGISAPVLGTTLFPMLDLNSVDVTAAQSGGGTLTLKLTDTDYVGGSGIVRFLESVGGTLSNGSYSVSTFMDCGNTAFGQSTSLTSQSFSGNAFSGSQSADVSACAGNYSLTQLAVLQLPGGSIFSGDALLAVPEPSTLALFGAGLLGLGFAFHRRRNGASVDTGRVQV